MNSPQFYFIITILLNFTEKIRGNLLYKSSDQIVLNSYDDVNPIIFNVLNPADDKVSLGFWFKITFSDPMRTPSLLNTPTSYSMGVISLTNDPTLTTYADVDRLLQITLKKSVINFKLGETTSFDYDYTNDQIEGVWVMIYCSLSLQPPPSQGICFIKFSSDQVKKLFDLTNISTAAALSGRVQYTLGQVTASAAQATEPFPGSFYDIRIHDGMSSFISNIVDLQQFIKLNFNLYNNQEIILDSSYIRPQATYKLLEKPREFDEDFLILDTTPDNTLELYNSGEFSTFGWIQIKQPQDVLIQELFILRVTINPESILKDNNSPGDRVFLVQMSIKPGNVAFNCFTYWIDNSLEKLLGQNSVLLTIPITDTDYSQNIVGFWTFIAVSYSRITSKVCFYVRIQEKQFLSCNSAIYMILPSKTYIYLGSDFIISPLAPQQRSVINGQIRDWVFENFSGSSFQAYMQVAQKTGCFITCFTCSGPLINNCQSCLAPQIINPTSNKCLCGTGFFPDETTFECSPCDVSCETCKGEGKYLCTSCLASNNRISIFYSEFNIGPCPCKKGYFDDGISSQCLPCHFSCGQCTGLGFNSCTKCNIDGTNRIDKSDRNGGTCPCKKNHFQPPNSQICGYCHYSCEQCLEGDRSSCTKCKDERIFVLIDAFKFKGNCICKRNQYQLGIQCFDCHYSCYTCSGPTRRECTSCSINQLTKRDTYSNFCPCSSGYFDGGEEICQPCYQMCQQCSGASPNNCLTCDQTQKLELTDTAQCSCIKGYIWKETLDICTLTCHFSCETCKGPNSNQCLTCSDANFRIFDESGQCQCYTGYIDVEQAKCGKDGSITAFVQSFHNLDLQEELEIKFSTDLTTTQGDLNRAIQIEISNMADHFYKYKIKKLDNRRFSIVFKFSVSLQKRKGKIVFVDASAIRDDSNSPFSKVQTELGLEFPLGPVYLMEEGSEYDTIKKFKEDSDFLSKADSGFAQFIAFLATNKVFMILLNTFQINQIFLTINSVLPINFYLIIRIFSSFAQANVPDWEEDSPVDPYLIFNYKVEKHEIISQESPYRFFRIGITYSFLTNCQEEIIVFSVLAFIFLPTLFQYRKKMLIGYYSQSTQQMSQGLGVLFVMYLSYLESSFFKYSCSLIFQVVYWNFDTSYNIVSYIVAMVFLGTLLFTFGFIFFTLKDKLIDFDKYPVFLLQPLFEDLRHNYTKNLFLQNYHVINYLKKIFIIFLMCFSQNQPLFQIYTLLITHIFYFLFDIIIYPYKNIWHNRLQSISNFLIAVIFFLLIPSFYELQKSVNEDGLMDSEGIQTQMQYGWAMGIIYIIFHFLHIAIFLIKLIDSSIEAFKNRKFTFFSNKDTPQYLQYLQEPPKHIQYDIQQLQQIQDEQNKALGQTVKRIIKKQKVKINNLAPQVDWIDNPISQFNTQASKSNQVIQTINK